LEHIGTFVGSAIYVLPVNAYGEETKAVANNMLGVKSVSTF